MTSNPKPSPWYSTPRDARRRKPTELTLPEATRKALDKLAKGAGVSRSVVVERLIGVATVEMVVRLGKDDKHWINNS